jgi:hypothetical protein
MWKNDEIVIFQSEERETGWRFASMRCARRRQHKKDMDGLNLVAMD